MIKKNMMMIKKNMMMIKKNMMMTMIATSAVTIPGAFAMPLSWTPLPANTNTSPFQPAWL